MCQANLFKKRADLKSQRKFLDTPYVENIDILRKNLTWNVVEDGGSTAVSTHTVSIKKTNSLIWCRETTSSF